MTKYKMLYYCKRCIISVVIIQIIAVLFFCSVPADAYSSNTPSLTGEVVSAQPNGTVIVKINLTNNPGIVSATIYVSYDSNILTLTNVKDGGLLGAQTHKPEYTSPYTLAWANDTATTNYTVNGTIATLSFKVSNRAVYGRTYPIVITYNYENYDIFDKDLNAVKFQTVNGAVKISKDRSFILGDVNRDSKVTTADTISLQKFVAQLLSNESIEIVASDVDEDGYTSVIDVTYIQRYLSKISVPYPIGSKIT